MPDKSQQQVVDSVIIKGTLLPGLTKASKYEEEKKPLRKLRTKKTTSPYQDDSQLFIETDDHNAVQLSKNDAHIILK